jgi:glycosyltransferase involved in cell wall biosynthesis
MLNKARNVIFFTKYDESGASSRLRIYQYFAKNKHNIYPLFDKRYINLLYSNSKLKYPMIVKAYYKRMLWLIKNKNKYLFVIEKELFPWVPWFIEKYFLGNSNVIIDIDDAIFHKYDKGFTSFLLKNKYQNIFNFAKYVIVGNEYIREYAVNCGAKNVSIYPTVISPSKYKYLTKRTENSIPIILWIGSPSTQKYLIDVMPFLIEIYKHHDYNFKVIGANIEEYLNHPFVSVIKWSEKTEYDEINNSDIGIMPLPDNPFEKGKCGYKLIQYMSCSLPVIASPVGVNKKIITNGYNGYLCSDKKEWCDALIELLNNKEKRRIMGQNGYEIIKKEYSFEVYKKKYFDLIFTLSDEKYNKYQMGCR